MVSKASEDLPEPDKPVNTTSRSRGISTSTFFRLCSRAPRMVIARVADALCWRFARSTSSITAFPGALMRALCFEHDPVGKPVPTFPDHARCFEHDLIGKPVPTFPDHAPCF